MNIEKMKDVVNVLNDKAAMASDATDAMKFAQAALNAANSYCSLDTALKARGN